MERMNKEKIEAIKKFIDEYRKSMKWYERYARDVRTKYLGWKFRVEDWFDK